MVSLKVETQTLDDLTSGLFSHLVGLRHDGKICAVAARPPRPASADAIAAWEDANLPYTIPDDLRAFVAVSDGFSLSFSECISPCRCPSNGKAAAACLDALKLPSYGNDGDSAGPPGKITLGHIYVAPITGLARVPLDGDDIDSIARCRRRHTLRDAGCSDFGASQASGGARSGTAVKAVGGGASVGAAAPLQAHDHPLDSGSCWLPDASTAPRSPGRAAAAGAGRGFGIGAVKVTTAAFEIDACGGAGRVVLLFGDDGVCGGGDGRNALGHGAAAATVAWSGNFRRSSGGDGYGCSDGSKERGGGGAVSGPLGGDGGAGTSEPWGRAEVWFQDLACDWHYVCPSFAHYFRLAVAHVGVLGWQLAYTPCGPCPASVTVMRRFCPGRLRFDTVEARKHFADELQHATLRQPCGAANTSAPPACAGADMAAAGSAAAAEAGAAAAGAAGGTTAGGRGRQKNRAEHRSGAGHKSQAGGGGGSADAASGASDDRDGAAGGAAAAVTAARNGLHRARTPSYGYRGVRSTSLPDAASTDMAGGSPGAAVAAVTAAPSFSAARTSANNGFGLGPEAAASAAAVAAATGDRGGGYGSGNGQTRMLSARGSARLSRAGGEVGSGGDAAAGRGGTSFSASSPVPAKRTLGLGRAASTD